MTALFITGSGTDIGKTWVSCLLIHQARARGMDVSAFKPVLSGFDPEKPEQSDAGLLLRALGRPVLPEALDEVSPWRFRAPLSVDMAAKREGVRLDYAELIKRTRLFASAPGLRLVEGVGGVMAPLDDSHTILDWMQDAQCPVLLVCGTYLGALSHGLTAYEVLKARGFAIGAVLVNESPETHVCPEETLESFRPFIRPVPLVLLRRQTDTLSFSSQPDLIHALFDSDEA